MLTPISSALEEKRNPKTKKKMLKSAAPRGRVGILRIEQYITAIAGKGAPPEYPITREEFFLDAIYNVTVPAITPITRIEKYLYYRATKSGAVDDPVTNDEYFWAAWAGFEVALPEAVTNLQILLRDNAVETILDNIEAYSKVVPSGAHAAELESIGGKSAMVDDSPVHADVDRIEIYGKNYFDPDDYYNLYTNREYNIGGYTSKAIHLCPNTTYTVSIHAAAAKSAPTILINSQSYVSKEPYCDLRKASDTRTFTTGDDGNLYIGTNSVDAPTNRRLAELEIQIEIGSAATAYSPYHAPTEYPIPAAVRALEGYGQSEVGGQGNTVDFSNGIYTEYGHYEDGAWVAEDTPIVTDISDLLTGFDPLMDVEGGGALTFHQSGGTELAVPNSVKYYIYA